MNAITQNLTYKYQHLQNNTSAKLSQFEDNIAVESPLEIHLIYWHNEQRYKFHFTTLMCTPGFEPELIYGLLYNEQIISSLQDVYKIRNLGNSGSKLWRVELAPQCDFNPDQHRRNLIANSSCGICSQTNHNVTNNCSLIGVVNHIHPTAIFNIIQQLNSKQTLFQQTGGVHGVGICHLSGNILFLAEDVGRHNACDKVIGMALVNHQFPLDQHCLVFSGRVSFELVQKAIRCNVSIILALGAPSSLAINMAEQSGITLIGFIRNKSFNIYTHPWRIA